MEKTNYVSWETAKKYVHDASGVSNPNYYLWYMDTNGVYYPLI